MGRRFMKNMHFSHILSFVPINQRVGTAAQSRPWKKWKFKFGSYAALTNRNLILWLSLQHFTSSAYKQCFCHCLSRNTPTYSGWNFKAVQHNKVRFTWGWADIMSMDQIFEPIRCISSDGQKWGGVFFWPITFSHQCCDWYTYDENEMHA